MPSTGECPLWVETLRQDAEAMFKAGVDAADPQRAVERALHVSGGQLEIRTDLHTDTFRSEDWQRVHVVAIGKAACAMGRAVQRLIPPAMLGSRGLVVTNYENVVDVPDFEVLGAGHPLPDDNGRAAANAVVERLREAQAGDLVLVLISGGGSALLPCPPDEITLTDKIATTDLLLACGADIGQINTVRKQLSLLKGGGLAKLAAPASVHALILSDVIGDDLSAIASGPTVPDTSAFADAINILKSKSVWKKTPEAVRRYLQAGVEGKHVETLKPGDAIFRQVQNTLIGGNTVSLEAVYAKATECGYPAQIYSKAFCGEARVEAQRLAKAAADKIETADTPFALIAGGETTVVLHGDGKGGRNQEMTLAFALAAQGYPALKQWVFLSGGTDGRDGPTDAAGGIADPWTLQRIRTAGYESVSLLENNDSYTALNASDDLLRIGATGTNVADLQIALCIT